MFEEKYLQLSNQEKEDCARVVNNLMLKSFVLRENSRYSRIISIFLSIKE